ncbi:MULTISPECIES: hypothetical protein [unclassified Streptomyces]|uniref:hypothetical protein n=1 Tax=unclassified Streptomyces TaxID=2593676 RepID=UPI000823C4CC|nr:hypothetical protein [Streptomyces sp. AmelKG-D3]MYT96970.1 hypothetical protein [Streptomyces sp. SID8350]SCK62910.1 hypothetical protein YUWDRAFT_06702 [Streptomyces sp. AmelKG-D3]
MAAWPDFYPCTCIAVDAQAYGSNNDRRQSEIQHDLPRLLDHAARRAGLDRDQWQIQRKGDEQLAVRPVDGSEPRLVDDYIRHLVAELRDYNAQRVPEARMRLRAAIHQGLVELADNGFAGTAVVVTSRLLNARPLYEALAEHPGADLVLVLSDEVFRSTVVGRHTSLLPEDFTRVDAQVKEYGAAAWLRVPEIGSSAAFARASGKAESSRHADHASEGSAAARSGLDVASGSDRAGISNEYQADQVSVNNLSGPVDARGAVFGFGSAGG